MNELLLQAQTVRRRWLWEVLITDRRDQSEFHNDAKHMGRNIGTPWVVAEIFREFFFGPFGSRQARFNGNPRRGRTSERTVLLCSGSRTPAQVMLGATSFPARIVCQESDHLCPILNTTPTASFGLVRVSPPIWVMDAVTSNTRSAH